MNISEKENFLKKISKAQSLDDKKELFNQLINRGITKGDILKELEILINIYINYQKKEWAKEIYDDFFKYIDKLPIPDEPKGYDKSLDIKYYKPYQEKEYEEIIKLLFQKFITIFFFHDKKIIIDKPEQFLLNIKKLHKYNSVFDPYLSKIEDRVEAFIDPYFDTIKKLVEQNRKTLINMDLSKYHIDYVKKLIYINIDSEKDDITTNPENTNSNSPDLHLVNFHHLHEDFLYSYHINKQCLIDFSELMGMVKNYDNLDVPYSLDLICGFLFLVLWFI